MVNSRQSLVTATLSCSPVLVWITLPGYLFFRSYETILPSSLARVFSRTLGFSPCLPVAVSGTDNLLSHSDSFSWQCGVNAFVSVDTPLLPHVITPSRIYLRRLTTHQNLGFQSHGLPSLLRPSAANNDNKLVQEYQPAGHRLRLSASS